MIRIGRKTVAALPGFNSVGAMYNAQPLIKRLTATLIFGILLSFGVAWGEDGYTSAHKLAQAHGLTYKDISKDNMHACRLSDGQRSITLFANLRSVMIDGAVVQLSKPVTWNGTDILLPTDAVTIFNRKFGTPKNEKESPASPVTPPAISPANPSPPVRKRTYKVVLDPGHGGKFPGAVGSAGLQEKIVNLDITLRLARKLREKGVVVTLTRDRDMHLSSNLSQDLNKRVEIANRANPDLFMSIHANAEASRRDNGAMSLYPDDVALENAMDDVKTNGSSSISRSELGADGPLSKAALITAAGAALDTYRARSIQASRIIQAQLTPVTGTVERSNGVIEDWRGLRVLRNVRAPAVLVEVDFLSNRASEKRLKTIAYREKIATALAEAIQKYLNALDQEMK